MDCRVKFLDNLVVLVNLNHVLIEAFLTFLCQIDDTGPGGHPALFTGRDLLLLYQIFVCGQSFKIVHLLL